MSKRARSTSPAPLRPTRANKTQKPIDDLREFARDLQESVNQMMPTGGRRYEQAAILAVSFSRSDIPSLVPLRNELLDLLHNTYNWKTEKYIIDCRQTHVQALFNLDTAVSGFISRNAVQDPKKASLVCIYFSGHGFPAKKGDLNICGWTIGQHPNLKPGLPYIEWGKVGAWTNPALPPNLHQLAIMDCCASGLANLNETNVEVLGASAWESTAPDTAQESFTRALINELKSAKGDSITTTQLISRLHSRSSVCNGMSMPVHKSAVGDRAPALIHRIETTPPPSPTSQISTVAKYSHVIITVKLSKENTIPSAKQWATWLKTNLPSYIGEIEIRAQWKTGSALVVFVMPIEIWLGLPQKEAYTFVDYDYAWDATVARQKQLSLLQPPPQEQGLGQRQQTVPSGNTQQRRPPPQGQGPGQRQLAVRGGNTQQRPPPPHGQGSGQRQPAVGSENIRPQRPPPQGQGLAQRQPTMRSGNIQQQQPPTQEQEEEQGLGQRQPMMRSGNIQQPGPSTKK